MVYTLYTVATEEYMPATSFFNNSITEMLYAEKKTAIRKLYAAIRGISFSGSVFPGIVFLVSVRDCVLCFISQKGSRPSNLQEFCKSIFFSARGVSCF